MGRSTVHYADNETNNILKRLHNKLRPAGTPVERVEYIIELLLLRIFEAKLKQDELFNPLRKLFEGENYRLLFSYIHSISNGDRILSELNKNIFPFYATILQEVRKVIKGNLPPKMQDQLVLMEEVFTNSNFTNNVRGGVITEVIGLVNEIDEKYILKTDLLGDTIESALSETGGTKDLGLYRTPDHIRRMMVAMIDPDFTDIIFDPACGTAGFLFDSYDYVIEKSNRTNKYPTLDAANIFYRTGIGGIEYQGRIRKMAAVNMYIRGLNPHNIEQGDSLKMFDPSRDMASKSVVIANPPFGAERDQPAYPNVWEDFSRESETTILFVKLMYDYLKHGGRCAVVVSEGFLTWGQGSACALRKMLLENTNLRAIISLPQGVFVSKGGQGAKTSILYFEKGCPTEFIWYYKIENDGFSMGTNRKPIEGSQIPELLMLFNEVRQGKRPEDTQNSFCINREQIETLDPRIEKRIKEETALATESKLAAKWKKKFDELKKKFDNGKISKAVYQSEVNSLAEEHIAITENEITKAIEKAHSCHFNLQNYRSNLTSEQQAQILKLLPNRGVNPADALHIDLLREHLSQNADNLTPELRKVKEILRQKDKFQLVALRNLLTFKRDVLELSEYNNDIQIVDKIRFSDGKIFLRKENKTKINLQYCDLDNLIISKINFHQGAIALNDVGRVLCSLDYIVYEININLVNPQYLPLILKNEKFLQSVKDNKPGGVKGRSQPDFIETLQIPLPPLEIQNEIVEKIERQKEIINGAEKIEKSITFEIEIDSQWEKHSLNDLCIEIIVGGTPKEKDFENGSIIYLKVNSLGFNLTLNFNNEYFIDDAIHDKELKRSRCYPGDVLMNIVGPPMGKVAIVPDDIPTCNINQAVICFRVSNKILNKYLAYYLLMPQTQDILLEDVRKSTGQWNITKSICSKLQISLPSIHIQRQIIEYLDHQMAALSEVRYLKSESERRIEDIIANVWGEKTKEVNLISTTKLKENEEEKATFKRIVLANYIINKSLEDISFGNVKFEKLLYLADCFAIKRNFGQNYSIQAAGPYDNVFTKSYFTKIEQYKWFKIQKRDNNLFAFNAGEKHDKSLNTYGYFSKDELERVNTLIDYFKKYSYEQPEIIATLYAVWNNRIIRQQPITDELLKEDFLNWDKQKIKYKNRLDNALKWMSDKSIVPDGWGKVIDRVEKKPKKK